MRRLLRNLLVAGVCWLPTLSVVHASSDTLIDQGINIVNAPPFTTPELLTWSIAGLPSCVDWCVTGISFRLIVRGFPPSIRIETTPHIAHNSPDFVILTHPQVGDGPWSEWASIVGTAEVGVITPLLTLMSGQYGLVPGGGQSQTTNFGAHQATTFKEAQVIGHPLSLLPLLLSGDGQFNIMAPNPTNTDDSEDCQVTSCLEFAPGIGAVVGDEAAAADCVDGVDPDGAECTDTLAGFTPDVIAQRAISSVQTWLTDWPNNARSIVGFMTPEFVSVFSIMDTVGTIRSLISAGQTFSKLAQAGAGFGVSLGAERVMCPPDVLPFVPYYLSAVDAFFWREGFPVTDLAQAATILNPLSSDRIGDGFNLWGHLYPRHGFADNNVDQHVGAVIATRAAAIIDDGGVSNQHLRWPLPARLEAVWQPIYPTQGLECTDTIAESDIQDNAENAAYAWNRWRRYDCDMSDQGSLITTVDLPAPVCISL